MDAALFHAFQAIAYDQAGIALRDGKEALVEARIGRRIRDLGLASAADYLEFLKADRGGDELVRFLDAISTNFTSFFREPDHFEHLREQLAERLEGNPERLRIWCAAASTGEEPYSLAITLAETLAGREIDWRILATDISTRVLAVAKAGRYQEKQLSRAPAALRKRWFRPTETPGTEEVHPALRERVHFARLNLAKPPYPMQGPFDAVFCRNVMIYFDTGVRQALITEIERLLAPGGLLCIGHSETLAGLRTSLRPIRPSEYRQA